MAPKRAHHSPRPIANTPEIFLANMDGDSDDSDDSNDNENYKLHSGPFARAGQLIGLALRI